MRRLCGMIAAWMRWQPAHVHRDGRGVTLSPLCQNTGREDLGETVFKQTIRFEDAKAAHEFDQHVGAFLRSIDGESASDAACLFTASRVDGGAYVRVVQTDCADLLGRLLTYLSARDFPPATQVERQAGASTH